MTKEKTHRKNLLLPLLAAILLLVPAQIRSAAQTPNGSYDLLIRPPDAVSPLEAQSGLINGDYLYRTDGESISQAQLDAIRAMAGVEIAAPISVVGSFVNQAGGINLEIPHPVPYTRYTLGVRLTNHGEPYLEKELTLTAPAKPGKFPFNSAGWSVTAQMNDGGMMAGSPLPGYWNLLIGIDPAAEAALTGLDQSADYKPSDRNDYLTDEEYTTSRFARTHKIPVLVNEQAYQGLELTVRLNAALYASDELLIDETFALADMLRPLSREGLSFNSEAETKSGLHGYVQDGFTAQLLVSHAPRYTILEKPAIPQEGPVFRLAKAEGDYWKEAFLITKENYDLVDESIQYFPQNELTLLPYGTRSYRKLELVTPPQFTLFKVGRYDPQTFDLQEKALLGFYAEQKAVLRYDKDGNQLETHDIFPSLLPGDFLTRQPMALTTLSAAAYLREESGYIDAIRVRLTSGIDSEEIRDIAAEISAATGLHVDIVDDAEVRKVPVRVSGVGYVEMDSYFFPSVEE